MDGLALVVGASSAIGTAVATELADAGLDLALWGRDDGRLEACAAAVRERGRRARTATLDVRDRSALQRAAADVGADGGRERLRVVVWAAGVFDWAPAHRASPAAWDEVLDVNLAAAAALTPQVLPALVRAAPSALVYVGSGAAHRAYPGNAAYVASKHGLAGLAEAVLADVRDLGVGVSLVSPGLVAAAAGLAAGEDPQRLLQPADVAAAVRFVVEFPARGCVTQVRLEPRSLRPPAG